MRVHHQQGFVLLNRPYSESSWITELFTRDHGRIAVIAKGARRIKSPFRGNLLPFLPLSLSWTGKGEVPTLTAAELQRLETPFFSSDLLGDALICGFYCNELVSYLLHRNDPHPQLFDLYQALLLRLHQQQPSQLALELRNFEQAVMRETGYAVNFSEEGDHKTPIRAHRHYVYQVGEGFRNCAPEHKGAISGRVVLSLNSDSESTLSGEEMAQGKQLMRAILAQSLGHRSINSRDLFVRSLSNSTANN